MSRICAFCRKPIDHFGNWASTIQGPMHSKCFEVWKKKNFRKVLRNAMKKLKALSKDEKIRSSLSTVTDHEEAKERVMSLLEDAGFIVCTEVLMPRYRQDLIDYILHGTSPLMRSRRIFGTLPRLDLVGLLVFNGYRDPSLVLGIEISFTSLQHDLLKLKKYAELYPKILDLKIIVTNHLSGIVDDIKLTTLENFVDVIIQFLGGKIKDYEKRMKLNGGESSEVVVRGS